MNDHTYRNLYPDEPAYLNPGVQAPYHSWTRSPLLAEPDGGLRGGRGVAEVIVMEPDSFAEVSQVVQALREFKTVIVNLAAMDVETAQRAIDFVSGGAYAIDGNQEQIGDAIFLFTPNSIAINTLLLTAPAATPTPSTSIPPLIQRR